MAYIGDKPSQTLASPTSQYFNGDGSTVAFTLNRAVNVAEDLEVFVNNIQQEPGVGKSYTATGTTLTFDAAPSAGTANVYVVYRGLAEVTTRLEHDPNAALAATTGTFSGDLTVDTDTLYVDSTNNSVGIGTTSPSTSHRLTLDKSSNYGGIALFQSGSQVGQIIQEGATGNIYIDADSNSLGGGLIFRTDGGTTRMAVDGSGRITMPYQPAFYAWGSGNQSWSGTSAYQTLQLTNQVSLGSRNTGFNTTTYTFTAPIAGSYAFFARMTQTGTGTGPAMTLYKNGVGQNNEMTIGYGLAYMTATGFQFLQLAANDTVNVQVINYNNTSFTLDLGRCAFMGWLLG